MLGAHPMAEGAAERIAPPPATATSNESLLQEAMREIARERQQEAPALARKPGWLLQSVAALLLLAALGFTFVNLARLSAPAADARFGPQQVREAVQAVVGLVQDEVTADGTVPARVELIEEMAEEGWSYEPLGEDRFRVVWDAGEYRGEYDSARGTVHVERVNQAGGAS